jgi:CPA1 family monovalent cation:H+ antiporter
MGTFQVIAILLTLTALCSFINYRYLHLHTSIGVMLLSLLLSLALVLLGDSGLGITPFAKNLLAHVHFNEALLQWMLGFLLFAGAMHVDVRELARQRGVVALLATAGTAASMFIVGGLTFVALRCVGLPMPRLHCMLFGALISPTDPVAVLAIMKVAGAPKSIETKLAGESLFNDGIGVVLFLTLLAIAQGNQPTGFTAITWLLLRQVVGGALIGFLAGALVFQLLKRVDQYQVEVLLTLALAMGGYALADALHTSAPIAAVVSGMLIGNTGRSSAMSAHTREHLDTFWELIDETLNAVLFLMIGLVMLTLHFNHRHWLAVLLIIPVVLFARWCSVAASIALLSRRRPFQRGIIPILTWGGLRGGLSVAMALSLPESDWRGTIIAITYGVVIFSIAIQGTTIKRVVRRSLQI